MKRRKFAQSLLLAAALIVGSLLPSLPARADAMRVVTLGADLSQAQQETMLKYFKVSKDEVRIIYVTIQDEIAHLATYVPMEQIGTRTVSCAYVRPTTSGGIKVRTANLNWVTGNMIAASLSTSGVTNCEVIAACPFEVSGTGALTGVQMAYEVAVGEKLDERKKEIATEEIVVTGNVGNAVGQDAATYVINRAKIEVLGRGLTNYSDIYNLVVDIVDENHLYLSDEMIYDIVNLLEEMVAENYVYEDVVDTLAMVGSNVAQAADDDFFTVDGGFSEIAPPEMEIDDILVGELDDDFFDEDSIVTDLDESVLGDDVVVSSTLNDVEADDFDGDDDDDDWLIFDDLEDVTGDPAFSITDDDDDFDDAEDEDDEPADGGSWLQQLFGPADDDDDIEEADDDGLDDIVISGDSDDDLDDDAIFDDDLFDEDSDDDMIADDNMIVDGGLYDDEAAIVDPGEDARDTGLKEDEELDISYLSAEKQRLYKLAETFCTGEYQGKYKKAFKRLKKERDIILDNPSVSLDTKTGKELTKLVLDRYLGILGNGGYYTPSADDEYVSPELNMIQKALQAVFGVDTVQDDDAKAVLANVWDDDASTLYEETMTFFAKLYDEYDEFAVDEIMSLDDLDDEDMAVVDTSLNTTGTASANSDDLDDDLIDDASTDDILVDQGLLDGDDFDEDEWDFSEFSEDDEWGDEDIAF